MKPSALLFTTALLICTSQVKGEAAMSTSSMFKRLGLNRVIGDDMPSMSSSKKQGESTVYYIKLPAQPFFYIPNIPVHINAGNKQPYPFETVPLEFNVNGRPENVYHWNLPLGITHAPPSASAATTSTTTEVPATTTTTTPQPVKKPLYSFKKNFLNNGKPQNLYVMKGSYRPLFVNSFTNWARF